MVQNAVANPVSAGTTVVGMDVSFIGGGCASGLSALNFTTSLSGNLDTQIDQVQLWADGTLVATSGFSTYGFNFTGSPIVGPGNHRFLVEYVLSPTASGYVQTTLTYIEATDILVLYGNLPSTSSWVTVGGGSSTSTMTSSNTTTSIPTFTLTPTTTNTFTLTPTGTYTPTQSLTFTPTPTVSMAPSVQLTVTASLTPTPTASTVTFSPTSTPTLVWTPAVKTPTVTTTWTAAPASTVAVYPNPAKSSTVNILLPSYGGTSNVKIVIMTVAYMKVFQETISQVPSGQSISLPLMSQWNSKLANGLYYIIVTTKQGQSIAKLLILR
jgi:hypothetical protein